VIEEVVVVIIIEWKMKGFIYIGEMREEEEEPLRGADDYEICYSSVCLRLVSMIKD
jgi:hypothetical protein